MILKDAWFGMKRIQREVCCQRLADNEEIEFQDGAWHFFGEGITQIPNISYCPFCGTELPLYKKEDRE